MNQEIIKIKCPCCGAVLSVANTEGIETKMVTCPNCKTKNSFASYKRVVPVNKVWGDETRLPGTGSSHDDETKLSGVGHDDTVLSSDTEDNIGVLVMHPERTRLRLKLGVNIVGRQSSSGMADVQIPTDNLKVSRKHSKVEVRLVPGKGYCYYISNAENKNSTYVNGTKLENGECLVLQPGDEIMMADLRITFEKQEL